MLTNDASNAPTPLPLRRRTVTQYALGSLATGGFSTLPGLVLLYYMTDVLAVSALVAGLVIGIVKVWDVVADPVIGALSDADEQRTGSRRRFLLIGAITLPICFILTFGVPEALSPTASAVWVGVAFLACATAFSIFQVPYIALPAAITPAYDQRTRLLTARVVVLSLAILIFGGGGPMLRGAGDNSGYLTMAAITAIVLLVGALIAVPSAPKGLPSPVRRTSVLRAYRTSIAVLREEPSLRALIVPFFLQALATGLMLAGAQYVATHIMRNEDAITFLFVALIAPAVLAAPLWQWLSARTSKRFAFQLASVLFAAATLLLAVLLIGADALVYIPVGIAGVAYAGMQSLPMAMLPDAMSHDRARSGKDRAGVIGGVWTAAETTGFAFGGMLLAIALGATGYVSSTGTVVQPESAVLAIGICFSILPALLTLASLIPLRRYSLARETIDTERTTA